MFELSLPQPPATDVESDLDKARRNSGDLNRDTLELLRHFEGPDYKLPPSARVDPTVRQRQRERLGFFDLWKYVVFVVGKSTSSTFFDRTSIDCYSSSFSSSHRFRDALLMGSQEKELGMGNDVRHQRNAKR